MQKGKKSGKVISMPVTPENQIRTRARNLAIGDCWITEDWKELREANILVTRKHNQGGVTFGVFLIDLALFGLKDTFYQFNMPPFEFDDFIRRYTEKEQCVKIDYTLAHNLIYGAIAYAEEYDFHPHKDFSVSQYILEDDTEEVPLIELEFGLDGLPTVFKSTENPRVAEIRQLERLVGKGNFKVIDLGKRPGRMPGDLIDQDLLDEDKKDDPDWYDDAEVDPDLVEEYLTGVDWQTIYSQCNQIFALKPWETLSETDNFVIKLPGSGKEFFVSVMGSNGEVFALSFYEGQQAIYKFFELQDEDLNYHPTSLLAIPHFMISWEVSRELEPIQAAILHRLGIEYTGKKVWPQINQVKPGYLPGIADLREFKNIGILLGQCLEILPRAIKNPSLLWEHPDLQNTFLFRIPKKARGEWVWNDEFRIPATDPVITKFKYDRFQLEEYKQLPVKWKTLQVDVVLQPFPIPDREGKIKYHFMLIGLDPKTELIILAQMLKLGGRYITVLKGIPNLIMNEMITLGGRPAKFEFRNPDLSVVMQFFKDLAGTKFAFKRELEPLGMLIISLIDQLVNRKSQ